MSSFNSSVAQGLKMTLKERPDLHIRDLVDNPHFSSMSLRDKIDILDSYGTPEDTSSNLKRNILDIAKGATGGAVATLPLSATLGLALSPDTKAKTLKNALVNLTKSRSFLESLALMSGAGAIGGAAKAAGGVYDRYKSRQDASALLKEINGIKDRDAREIFATSALTVGPRPRTIGTRIGEGMADSSKIVAEGINQAHHMDHNIELGYHHTDFKDVTDAYIDKIRNRADMEEVYDVADDLQAINRARVEENAKPNPRLVPPFFAQQLTKKYNRLLELARTEYQRRGVVSDFNEQSNRLYDAVIDRFKADQADKE